MVITVQIDTTLCRLKIRVSHGFQRFNHSFNRTAVDVDQDLAAIEAELAPPPADTSPRPPRARAGRQALPEHLERIDIRHEPESCTCGHCQRELVKIGEDVSEQLDIEPARFFVIRHIRPQYVSPRRSHL